MKHFSGASAEEVWVKAIDDVSTWPSQPSRLGDTRELLRAWFLISDPRQRWVASRTPPMSPALAIAELAWILAGDDRLAYLTPWNRDHAKFVGNDPKVYGAYGERLRRTFDVDQILGAARALRSAPSSRQVVLQIYDPKLDMPNPDGLPQSADIPCNVTSMLKVRDNRLQWTQVLRSNDLHLGVPYNFVQFTTLQEIIAGLIGIDAGEYAHYSDSLHIYEKDLTRERTRYGAVVERNVDDLRISLDDFDSVLRMFHSGVEDVGTASSEKELGGFVTRTLPEAWRNLVLVCASERARRIGNDDLSECFLGQCSNPCLRSMQRAYAASRRPRDSEHERPLE